MLASILESHRSQFNAMAQAWLSMGAASVALFEGRFLRAVWPEGYTSQGNVITGKVVVDQQEIAELRIAGADIPGMQVQLNADVNWISSLIPLERDLQSATFELIETRDQLVALYELTQLLRNSITLKQSMDLITTKAASLVNARKAFFILHFEAGGSNISHFPENEPVTAELQPFLSELERDEHQFISANRTELKNSSALTNLLIVPVQILGAKFAAIGVADRPGDEFMSPAIKMLQTVAQYAAASVENVLMVEANLELVKLRTEMDLAHQVQSSLLPKKMQVAPGLDIWAASQPASRVGGDFYDFIEAANGSFTFLVSDVSGKGVPAALLMAMTRSVIRTDLNRLFGSTPAEVICHANEELYEDFTSLGMFATLFVGQFQPGNNRLVYANAGHSPVIYCPKGGSARLLQADGIPVGILKDTFSRDQALSLAPGDILAVGTDGFNEMRNKSGDMLGHERLMALVESLAEKPAREIAETLYASVSRFGAGALPDDDQTLVVLKYTGV